jgi:carbon monoxide dehydrogenase subunit G
MPSEKKSVRASGGAQRTAQGRVPIDLSVTREEREEVRVAAALAGCSMAELARRTILEEARKIKQEHGL